MKPRRDGRGPLEAFVPWNNILFSKRYVTELYSFMLESGTQRGGRKTVRRNTAPFLEAEQHVGFKWPSSEEQGSKRFFQKSRSRLNILVAGRGTRTQFRT